MCNYLTDFGVYGGSVWLIYMALNFQNAAIHVATKVKGRGWVKACPKIQLLSWIISLHMTRANFLLMWGFLTPFISRISCSAQSRDDILLISRDPTTRRQIKQIATGWTSVGARKKSNMLNDKRIKSCLSRFDSGAYNRLQFLCAVSHSVGAHTKSLHPGRQQQQQQQQQKRERRRQLWGRRNRQRQPRQHPRTTIAKCASWRHVLALHWCRADIEHVDSIQDDAMMTQKTFRNWSINQSYNQSLFYSASKRWPESWPT